MIINNYTDQPRQLEQLALAVMAIPQTANDDLYQQLQGKIKQLYRIGDCLAPRRVEHAILDGERVAHVLPAWASSLTSPMGGHKVPHSSQRHSRPYRR